MHAPRTSAARILYLAEIWPDAMTPNGEAELREGVKLLVGALDEIAGGDYRGNRPHEQVIAYRALRGERQ
jgi:hypothetical protein